MAYRRTDQVIRRLAARRNTILAAARMAATEAGMEAVQIAPVARRARVAAGTVYRYFPSKADLIAELIADVTRNELALVRKAANAAPGPLSALAAAISTLAIQVLTNRKLAWAVMAEQVDVDVAAARIASRRAIVAELAFRIEAAIRSGHLPSQDAVMLATGVLGALHEGLIGPLTSDDMLGSAKMRDAVQTLTLFALRAVGVMDARARGLVVQIAMPATGHIPSTTVHAAS